MTKYRFITPKRVIRIHDEIIKRYGGFPGLRDYRLLESAVRQASAGFFGKYAHKNIFEMAATYLFHIIKNHAFIDGNKRTGLSVALLFLEQHKIEINLPFEELYEKTIDIAESKMSKEEIALFLKKNSYKQSRTRKR